LIAATLKVRRPDVLVVFGGANCEGVMSEALIKSYQCVDYAFSGPADATFAQFAEGFLRHGRRSLNRVVTGANPEHIDALPLPEFDDYFDQVHSRGLSKSINAGLVME